MVSGSQPHQIDGGKAQSTLKLLLKARKAKKDRTYLAKLQRERLSEVVAYARANSAFYGELYKGLPDVISDPRTLPVTNKVKLMAEFDRWVTDDRIKLKDVRAHLADPSKIGEKLLGEYTAITTSGTTGTPGIFLVDERIMQVVSVLMLRMVGSWLDAKDVISLLVRGWRMANIAAVGGHFAVAVAAAQHKKAIRLFSVHEPIAKLVEQLNEYQPTVFGGYASVVSLLTSEQESGRLKINPLLVIPIAEGLSPEEYKRIERTFGAKARTSYAASECHFISYSCEHNWLHVNSDWVVLEPVEADFSPTPLGRESHTVLISNLANRIQPILRYDLGDRVLQKEGPCECGNPLPAIRVQGRTSELLTFNVSGKKTSVPPLTFELDHVPGVDIAQIVQVRPESLRVRLRLAAGADKEKVWARVESEMNEILGKYGLQNIHVERAEEAPEQSSGGKYRTVLPLK